MFKNLGTTPVKYQYTIDLKDVILPDMFDEFDGTETLCIAFERKNQNLSYSEEKKISLNDQDEIVADFTKESFLAEVTLHRENKTGSFREKKGSLALLQRKFGVAGSTREAFKTLGIAYIPFHEFTDSKAHDRVLYLTGAMSNMARINVVIAGVPKDAGTQTNSASNDMDDGDSIASKSIASTSSQMNPYSYNNNTNANGFTTAPSTSTKGNVPAHNSGVTAATAVNKSSFPKAKDGNRYGSSDVIRAPSLLSFHSVEDKKFEQSLLYQNMKNRLEELEDTILSSAEIMDFDKTKIKELTSRVTELESENEHFKQQMNDLSFKIEHLQTDYQILTKENDSLKATIGKYTLEGGKLQSLLQKATDELNIQQDAKAKLEKLLKEKNDECEDLLQELIKTKVAVGDLNGELEVTKKELRTIKGGGRSAARGPPPGSEGRATAVDPHQQYMLNNPPRPRNPLADRPPLPPVAAPSTSNYSNQPYNTPSQGQRTGPSSSSSTDYYMSSNNSTPYTPSASTNNSNGYNSGSNNQNFHSRGGGGGDYEDGSRANYNPARTTPSSSSAHYDDRPARASFNGNSSTPSRQPPASSNYDDGSRLNYNSNPSNSNRAPPPPQSNTGSSNGASQMKRGFGGW